MRGGNVLSVFVCKIALRVTSILYLPLTSVTALYCRRSTFILEDTKAGAVLKRVSPAPRPSATSSCPTLGS